MSLLLLILTPSSGQVLVINSDTVSCFNQKELRLISHKLLLGQECDTLLKIQRLINKELRESVSVYKDIIHNDSLIAVEKDQQIKNREMIIDQKDQQIADTEGRLKWWKIKYWVSVGVLSGGIVYLLIN